MNAVYMAATAAKSSLVIRAGVLTVAITKAGASIGAGQQAMAVIPVARTEASWIAPAMRSHPGLVTRTPSGGGGLVGGMLGRFGRKKSEPKEVKAGGVPGRSTIMTSTSDTLSVQPTANAADVQVPAGFKLKNK